MMVTMIIGYCACTFFVVMELDLLYFLLGLAVASFIAARREYDGLPVIKITRKDIYIIFSGMVSIIFVVWLAAVKEII